MRFISLKYDFCFKSLMRNEEIRKYFISDVLEIPLGEIKLVRLANTFLWKRYLRQKQGILDVLLILNDDSKVNIELQIRLVKYWDRRILFYLAKMFTEDLLVGEKYGKLKKCISISILDFKIDDSPEYHRIYHLRDKKGNLFSDLFEVHILELGKKLEDKERMNDWIQLFNAGTEEELDMIKTENIGVLAAIREVKIMNLGRSLKALYEARMKEIRDRNARDEYVWDKGHVAGKAEGKAEGRAEGEAKGEMEKLISIVRKKSIKNMSAKAIVDLLEEDEALVTEIYDLLRQHPSWDNGRIYEELKSNSPRGRKSL